MIIIIKFKKYIQIKSLLTLCRKYLSLSNILKIPIFRSSLRIAPNDFILSLKVKLGLIRVQFHSDTHTCFYFI